jgi:cytoskeletal protein RodZ
MSAISHKSGGFGEALRAARAKAGVDLRHLSDVTRIQIRYIEALETEDWGSVPKGVIGRGFVRLISREIGGDTADLLERYRVSRGEDPFAHLTHYSSRDEEMDMTYGKNKLPAFGKMFNQGTLFLIGIAAGLVIIIGVVLWIWSPWAKKETASAKPARPAAEAAATSGEAAPKAAAAPVEDKDGTQPVAAPAAGILEVKALKPTWIAVEGEGIESLKVALGENEIRKFNISKAKVTFPDESALILSWDGAALKAPQKTGADVVVRFPEDLETLKP